MLSSAGANVCFLTAAYMLMTPTICDRRTQASYTRSQTSDEMLQGTVWYIHVYQAPFHPESS